MQGHGHHRIVECDLCGSVMRSDKLKNHRGGRCCTIRCDIYCAKIPSREYAAHKESHQLNLAHGFSTSSMSKGSVQCDEEVDDEFKDLYKDFGRYISTKTKRGVIMDSYNFQINNFY